MDKRMNIIPKTSTTKGADYKFTGDVYVDVILKGELPSHVRVNSVHFTPGARSAWHAHTMGQTLHVNEGIGVVQARGGEVLLIRAGDTVSTVAGEWHWHGAAKNHFMTHIAIWEAPEEGDEVEWGDHVTDEEYGMQPDN